MAEDIPGPDLEVSAEAALDLLATGEIDVQGLLPRSSNYTFLVVVKKGEVQALAVYKPRRGERPLWDFPSGTLSQREVAAHVTSEALGWTLVPPTVLRDGPHGPGMMQLYIHCDPRENYFTLARRFPDQFQRLALFDTLVNNADRKAGHCLLDDRGHIWGIDHGVCFHEDPKLRTVIWEFAGKRVPAGLIRDLQAFSDRIGSDSDPVTRELRSLLTAREVEALGARADHLVRHGRFPVPDPYERQIPWPPV
ncbi:MAG: SCO1664 family protein [Dehalococcoidia bacterium]|nr:SCO1664 family protein [Dehalococcoidia bacterium]